MNASIFYLTLRIIYLRSKIIKNIFIMKKQKLTSISLKFNKTNIANLNHIKAGAAGLSVNSSCCTGHDTCKTLTTRPDSLQGDANDN